MPRIAFGFHAEALEVAGFGHFALAEHRHQIKVGLGPNPGNLVLNLFDAVGWEMFDLLGLKCKSKRKGGCYEEAPRSLMRAAHRRQSLLANCGSRV